MSTEHHYFATCVFGWKVAATRREAVEGLAQAFRRDLAAVARNSQKAGQPGAYVWSCRVDAPLVGSKYPIQYYSPREVPIAAPREHAITYLTAKRCAFTEAHDETVPELTAEGIAQPVLS